MKKRGKFNNIKTNGFASKREYERYLYLLSEQHAGRINGLKCQVTFTLQDEFEKNDIKYKAITYIADFVYLDVKTCKRVVEDSKGFRTEVYKIKKKMFEKRYPGLTLVEV